MEFLSGFLKYRVGRRNFPSAESELISVYRSIRGSLYCSAFMTSLRSNAALHVSCKQCKLHACLYVPRGEN